jgi:transcriptional regulator with XRE-family HTH domain
MSKTPKSRALGNALRAARTEHELTLRGFGAQISRPAGELCRWENGDRIPRPEQVAQVLAALGINGERYDNIMTLAYNADAPMWVATSLPERKQQLAAYLDFERNASKIVEVAPLLVPGLLQTADYARAIMSEGGLSADDVESRVALRAGRREVLEPPMPAHLCAFIGQGALFQDIGGRAAALGQVRHLITMAQRPNIDLRIVPHGCGWHPALEGAFALMESEETSTVAFVETRRTMLYLHQESDVKAYRWAAEKILDVALDPGASLRFLVNVLKRMENE